MPAVRHPKYFALAVTMLAGMIWASGCGDGATEPPAPTPDPPRPTTVTVTPATAELAALGATAQLTVEVLDQNGRAMAGATVTWASSATAVAVADANGLVTAAGNGTATITATAGSASGSAAVTVAQEVSAVALSPAADTLVVGDTLRFSAEAADANGHPVDGAGVQWASSDTAVAVVDDSGLATGVSAGGAEITATASGITGRAALTVVDPVPAAVEVTPGTVELTALGETAELAAEVRDQIGRVMTAPVSWSSGDTLVAAVDSAGRVTAVGSGTTAIAATAGEARGEAVVSVMQAAGSVVVSPSADTIAPGDTLRMAAEAFDENGHRVDGAPLTWSSTNGSVARANDTGLVEGVAEGTATITATAGAASGTAEITVVNPDRAALVALYNATDGPNWLDNTNWLSDAPLGHWYGVVTDVSGRVTGLDLSGRWDEERQRDVLHGLSGPIPAELGSLASLERLHLSVNALSGAIPPELGDLGNLRELHLLGNRLTGPIPPELGGLGNLRELDLQSNQLAGPIPEELGGLGNLRKLDLFFNRLTGPIPREIGDLGNLRELSLAGNRLTGPIPREIGNLVSLERLSLGGNELTGPIPAEIGGLANLVSLQLQFNNLTGPIPPQLGGLARLDDLILEGNALTGSVPSELGNLSTLWGLYLNENDLSGPLPASLTDLRLGLITFDGNDGLCAPGTSDFVSWLQGIRTRHGPLCNDSDVVVLESLYEAAGGSGWTESDGWLGDGAVGEWHGVEADSLGRVTILDLTRNGLVGGLPPTLGDLTGMTRLRIGGNPALAGRLPFVLTRLPLREFVYADTELCASAEASFQRWLSGIASHEGTGLECAPLSDRQILEILYQATNGPNWINNGNWLSDAPLADWYGVHTDAGGAVVALDLSRNGLSGPIPPEIGNLTGLEALQLWSNDLSGPMPPEIDGLANLTTLDLSDNNLTGVIPPIGNLTALGYLELSGNGFTDPIPIEIGNLTALGYLELSGNGFTGPIPFEIGNLTALGHLGLGGNGFTGPIPIEIGNLTALGFLDLSGNSFTSPIPVEIGNLTALGSLDLGWNGFTGPIPPSIGRLTALYNLQLRGNRFSGPVPPEIGDLARLTYLDLAGNDLSGPVPPELAGLTDLKDVSFDYNSGMAGALPVGLTALRELAVLQASRTGLCAPSNPGFLAWLAGIDSRGVQPCGELAAAYLTQAVQSREFPVPLVAGRRALLRVFPIAQGATSAGIPLVRASFWVDGRERHVVNIQGTSTPIPTEVDEASLAKSANAEIPGQVLQPGLEMVIEIDPQSTLGSSLLAAKRIPEDGRLAVDVRAAPVLDLTVIPFIWSAQPDSSIVELVRAMASDPWNHEMLWDTRTLLPVGAIDVTAHEPVLTSTNDGYELLSETVAIRAMEGETNRYLGLMPSVSRVRGLARGAAASIAVTDRSVIAHELGHNMNLRHAPCGTSQGVDPFYPHPDGSIGAWGYDFRDDRLVAPSAPDVMSYCGPPWIGDYHFTEALGWRLREEENALGVRTRAGKALLLWGGAGADSVPYLEPAFVVDAPAALPDSAGEYRITGRADGGRELFSFSFTMPPVADGDGSSGFAFVLPVPTGWEGNLASISLSGPRGSATLDGDSNIPMAVLRNAQTGQIRGILRDPPPATQAAADAVGQGVGTRLDVLFSRGIPGREAWRR